MSEDKLKNYRMKREFVAGGEPFGGKSDADNKFVVQRHDASRLHFDFRLEIGGVLKSWALPKGPPTHAKEKRLAIAVEDHPIDYADFEGTIPEGQYGAGTVKIWDKGSFAPLDPDDPELQLKNGKFGFTLKGSRLNGRFTLVKTGFAAKSWLLISAGDARPINGNE